MWTLLHQSSRKVKPLCVTLSGGSGEKINRKDMGSSDSKVYASAMGEKWVPDDHRISCFHCSKPFSFTLRRHHCRSCGELFCTNCIVEMVNAPAWLQPAPLQEKVPASRRPSGLVTPSASPAESPPQKVTSVTGAVDDGVATIKMMRLCAVCHKVATLMPALLAESAPALTIEDAVDEDSNLLPDSDLNRALATGRTVVEMRKCQVKLGLATAANNNATLVDGAAGHVEVAIDEQHPPHYRVQLIHWRPFSRRTALLFSRVVDASEHLGFSFVSSVTDAAAPRGLAPTAQSYLTPRLASIVDDDDGSSSCCSQMTSASSVMDRARRSLHYQMERHMRPSRSMNGNSARSFATSSTSAHGATSAKPVPAPSLRADDLPLRFELLCTSLFSILPRQNSSISFQTNSEVITVALNTTIADRQAATDRLLKALQALREMSRARAKVRVTRQMRVTAVEVGSNSGGGGKKSYAKEKRHGGSSGRDEE